MANTNHTSALPDPFDPLCLCLLNTLILVHVRIRTLLMWLPLRACLWCVHMHVGALLAGESMVESMGDRDLVSGNAEPPHPANMLIYPSIDQ